LNRSNKRITALKKKEILWQHHRKDFREENSAGFALRR
jgi:hypothetical protein